MGSFGSRDCHSLYYCRPSRHCAHMSSLKPTGPCGLCFDHPASLASRRLFGVFVAALLSTAPSLASASCGDYVHVRGDGAVTGSNADSHLTASGPLVAKDHQLPANWPCQGPHCRRQPTAPAQPAGQWAGVPAQDLALFRATDFVINLNHHTIHGVLSPLTSTGHRSRLERPPRLAG
jgi:hypothetical protein